MNFVPYPECKSSGVKWLGMVPSHWKVIPIKRVGRLQGGAGFPHDSQGFEGLELPFHKVSALSRADQSGTVGQSANTITREIAKELGAFVFPPNSIVFAKVGAALLLGRVRIIDRESCIDNNMMGLVVDNLKYNVRYVLYAMTLVRFDLLANPGAVPSLNEGQIGGFRLAMPPLSEQKCIAAFLDRETAKIDALIAEQERLIALLNEKKQATVLKAVTQGLNPDAPRKQSGIEWLGNIPAHWNIVRLKHIAEVRTGVAKGKDNGTRKTIVVPYLRVANVQDGYLDLGEIHTMEIPEDDLEQLALKAGDVLMNEGGDFDKLGRGHVWEGQIDPCITQNHVFAVRPHGVSSAWLNLVTGSASAQFFFMSRSKQSTNLASISSTNLMELPIPLPPQTEQESILSLVEGEIRRCDELAAQAQHAIDLLKERRTALISAAVTGQIDVRDCSARVAA